MTRLPELLRDAAGTVDPTFDVADIEQRAHRRRRRRHVRNAGTLATIVAIVVASIVVVKRDNAPRPQHIQTVGTTTAPTTPKRAITKPHPVFHGHTGTTMLFDDGYSGVVALDLDTGARAPHELAGQGAGDFEPRLFRNGDAIITGPGWLLPLSGDLPHKLDPSTAGTPFPLPSARADEVWVTEYAGGCLGCGAPTMKLVRHDGTVVEQGNGLSGFNVWARIGVSNGVVFSSPQGLELWSPARGVLRTFGDGNAVTLASQGDLLAWCGTNCASVHFTNVVTGSDEVVPLGATTLDTYRSAFSPDGRYFAVGVVHGAVVIDLQTRAASTVFSNPKFGNYPAVTWSPDGSQLFVNSGGIPSTIGRYDVTTKRTETVTLPFGTNTYAVVAVTPGEAQTLFGPRPGVHGQPAASLFNGSTDSTLIYDDGSHGVALLDLDRSRVVRRSVTGQRAGDQPYRSLRSGTNLIVGWHQLWSVPLLGGPAFRLPDATYAFPATEPNLAWEYNDPTVSAGPELREIDTGTGGVVAQGPGPADGGTPMMGVAKHVAYETPNNGIDLWDVTNRKVSRHLGTGRTFVGAAQGSKLAWCDSPCTTLHFTAVDTGHDITIPMPSGAGVPDMEASTFSSDSSFAVPVPSGVVFVDVIGRTATLALHDARLGQNPSIAWSSDGHQLFVTSLLNAAHTTTLARYDHTTGDKQIITLNASFGNTFVTATNDEMGNFEAGQRATPVAKLRSR